MTLQEFKAWFEGYTEAMQDVPTSAEWARVKQKVADMKSTADIMNDAYKVTDYNGSEQPPGIMGRKIIS